MALDMDTRPAAYAVIIEQGKILLTHWTGETHPERAGWTLPGGGLEIGETAEDAVIREVYEESGYEYASTESSGSTASITTTGATVLSTAFGFSTGRTSPVALRR